jgi:nucleotide-binding universal stress UspA family protein
MPAKILCTTDGSKAAQKGVAYAVELAKRDGGSLTFLNVVTVSARRAARTYFWDQDILDAAAAQVHKVLGAATRVAAGAGLSGVSCVTVSGRNIPDAITAYAKKNDVNQIVVGSQNKRGAARLLLSSVAGGVAAKASCPVTIVP